MKSNGSLLDIHKYSNQAMNILHNEVSAEFEGNKEKQIEELGWFLLKLFRENEEAKKIIKEMDNIDGIKAQNSKSPNEKRVETWLKKAYFEHLYGGYSISRSFLLAFMISIIKPSSEEGKKKLKYSTTRYFEQYNDKFKKRLKRCRTNDRVLELQKQCPKFNITDAYAYGLIIDKFNTTNEDLEWFEKMIKILTKKKEA
ncbi:MAG TPA: hypothetical protein VLZ29_02635 [Sulfurimonas sp.]|uniref:hypothetical protein n=1 Tax=Sulfurimonas sp. TaxID=2022749 RepID=UPI002C2B1B51|nr:hypothetical protein [Sulfurimonas sp.]HUH41991.1 hypothetical protein [Sulfurimonas sp.]